MRFSREELVGAAFIAFGITLFVGFFYAAVLSKLLPPYENRLLAAIQNDWNEVVPSVELSQVQAELQSFYALKPS